MAIVRWDPFRDLNAIQERMNRLFGDVYRGADDDVMRRGAWAPPVDIYDSGNHELVIKAELPDMSKDDIEITVENNTLTLRGEKKMDSAIKDECCHRIERTYGAFSRTFSLPATVDTVEGVGRLQERRADHQAAGSRGSQAEADPRPGAGLTPRPGSPAGGASRGASVRSATRRLSCLHPSVWRGIR